MKCPVDSYELIKINYEDSVEIEYCKSCHGVWLDKGELEQIQDVKINDYKDELNKLTDYAGNAFSMSHAASNPSVNCPVCSTELERTEYGYCSQVLIDSCVQGHGVWLDKDELMALEIFYEKSRFEAQEIKKGFLAGLLDFFKK